VSRDGDCQHAVSIGKTGCLLRKLNSAIVSSIRKRVLLRVWISFGGDKDATVVV